MRIAMIDSHYQYLSMANYNKKQVQKQLAVC